MELAAEHWDQDEARELFEIERAEEEERQRKEKEVMEEEEKALGDQ